MAETDIAMPESTAVDSRPALPSLKSSKPSLVRTSLCKQLSRISRQFGLSAHVYKKYDVLAYRATSIRDAIRLVCSR